MFKEEIKKLAAEQVAERSDRNRVKAGTYGDLTVNPNDMSTLSPHALWFVYSDSRKKQRRLQIRIRHLIAAFLAGVAYATLEQRTIIPLYDLECAMVTVMRASGISHSIDAVHAWLDVDSQKAMYHGMAPYRTYWWTPQYLGIAESENVGASMA